MTVFVKSELGDESKLKLVVTPTTVCAVHGVQATGKVSASSSTAQHFTNESQLIEVDEIKSVDDLCNESTEEDSTDNSTVKSDSIAGHSGEKRKGEGGVVGRDHYERASMVLQAFDQTISSLSCSLKVLRKKYQKS